MTAMPDRAAEANRGWRDVFPAGDRMLWRSGNAHIAHQANRNGENKGSGS